MIVLETGVGMMMAYADCGDADWMLGYSKYARITLLMAVKILITIRLHIMRE